MGKKQTKENQSKKSRFKSFLAGALIWVSKLLCIALFCVALAFFIGKMIPQDGHSLAIDEQLLSAGAKNSKRVRIGSAASMGAFSHTGGLDLSCLFYFLTAFHLSFLPPVPLHVWISIPETPAVLPHFRSRRECQGGCTGQWIRWRAVECRNCSRVSFCGPSLRFPSGSI